MKKYLVALTSLVFLTSFGAADVNMSCGSDSQAVLELASNEDSHVFELGTGKDYKLCVSDKFSWEISDRGSGPEGYTPVLDVSSLYQDPDWGGHVGLPGEYPAAEKQLFMRHSRNEIKSVSTSCDDNCQFLVSLFSDGNSHAAEKDYFDKNVFIELGSPEGPDASLSLSHGVYDNDTKIKASYSAVSSSGAITSCSLDWGDGSTESVSDEGQKTHYYGASGTYEVVYTCTDESGFSGSDSAVISVPRDEGNTIYSDSIVTGFVPTDKVRTSVGSETYAMYSIENRKESDVNLKVELEGPSPEFSDGSSSKDISLRPGERRAVDIVFTSSQTKTFLNATVTNKDNGLNTTDSALVLARTPQGSPRNVSGIQLLHLIALMAAATSMYYLFEL